MDESQLQPTFERAKSTLRGALTEACRADLERADTGELIRIEEVLAIANEAAKEAISVRRRLRASRRAADPSEASAEKAPMSRELEDELGIRWRVFAVYPSTRSGRPAVRDRFRGGWLSFDCEKETRRVAPVPEGWHELSDDELRALCEAGERSPRRHAEPGR